MQNENNSLTADLLSNNGFIQCNRILIKALGLEGAALIGELCSQYRYYEAREMLKNEEYFYTTTDNITESIGLSIKKQRNLIEELKELEIIETKLMGMPCKRYFKINFKNLNNFMKNTLKEINAKSVEEYKKQKEAKNNENGGENDTEIEPNDTFEEEKNTEIEQNNTTKTDIQECAKWNTQEMPKRQNKSVPNSTHKSVPNSTHKSVPNSTLISTNKRMINKNRLTRVYVHTPIYEYESYFSVVDQNIPPTENKELNNLFKEWVSQKLAKKEQITICYLERNIFKVLSFAEENQIPSLIKCLENGWKNIYEVDTNTGKINFNLSEKEQKDIEYKDNLIKNTKLNNKLKEKQIEQIDTNIKLSKERAENYKQSKQLNDEFKKSRIKEIAYKTQNQNKTQKIENIFNNLNEKLVNGKEREYDNGANNEFNQSYTNILPICENS